ncbi:putative PEP-binding protein [Photobacterium nomapromontoriensis]|uniref:putative PEP-binding protein n=1 Tax=Photobacterium nomapromontoriensis TaxID=2910237 RepID=UPI003D0A1EA0
MENSDQTGLHFLKLLQSTSQFDNQDLGIGLLSLDDFIQELSIHPDAAAYATELGEESQQQLLALSEGSPAEYFVSMLTERLVVAARLAGDQPLLIRMTGADSHQRSQLLGAELEEYEVNPLLGLRGVSRYADEGHRKSFELECEAIKRARNAEGMTNIELVIPFVRTFSDAATAIDLLAEQGLCRGAQGLNVHLMAELPANALLTDKFLQYFDGLVVDVDQLAQFTLGLDQTHPSLEYLHDAQNEAVLSLVAQALAATSAVNKPCRVVSSYIHQSPNLQQWLQDHGVTEVITQHKTG